MKKKIIGFLVCMLLTAAAVLPVAGTLNDNKTIENLSSKLNFEDIILCGHSLGGAIIQQYYFQNPDEVAALILCGTGGRLRVSPFILNSLKKNYQEFLDVSLRSAFYRKTSSEIVDDYMNETIKVDRNVTYTDFKICDNFDTLDKTSTIDIPCLIICGKQDALTPPKYSNFFHDKIMTSELRIIDKAGHMVMLEKPDEVNRAIEAFIEGIL